jgi:hypothetical protein
MTDARRGFRIPPKAAPMKSPVQIVLIISLAFVAALPLAAKKKASDPLATLNFVVMRDENDKPVRNAAVVMHPVDEEGNQTRNGLELKTSPEGKASYEGVPYGKLRVQVLAPGFQTYGGDYMVNEPNMDITIKLKRPTKQYSIYEDHPAQQQPPPATDQKKPQ